MKKAVISILLLLFLPTLSFSKDYGDYQGAVYVSNYDDEKKQGHQTIIDPVMQGHRKKIILKPDRKRHFHEVMVGLVPATVSKIEGHDRRQHKQYGACRLAVNKLFQGC